MLKKLFGSMLLLGLVLVVSSPAMGDVVTGISYIDGVTIPGADLPWPGVLGVGVSSTWANESGWSPVYTIDGSGLDFDFGYHLSTASGNGWFAGGACPQWIIYDLGASYGLQAVRMWNYSRPSEPAWRQIKNVDVFVSATNQAVGNPAWGTAHPLTFAHITPSESVDFSETKVLQATGRYVLFYITSCWPDGGWEMPGMSEIRFTTTPVATWNLTVVTDPAQVTSVSPAVGTTPVEANKDTIVSASTFVGCPSIWDFSSWSGPVADTTQATTTIFMDANKTITAHFVTRTPVCNDACHPYPAMDFNHDCITDVKDFATFATDWLSCHQPGCAGY